MYLVGLSSENTLRLPRKSRNAFLERIYRVSKVVVERIKSKKRLFTARNTKVKTFFGTSSSNYLLCTATCTAIRIADVGKKQWYSC